MAALLAEVEAIRRSRVAYRMGVYQSQVTGLRSLLSGLSQATAAEHPYAVTERLCTDLGFRKAVYSPASRTGWSPTTIAFHPSIADRFRPLQSAIAQLSLPRGAAPREESVMRTGRSIVVEPGDVYRDTYRPLVELSRPRGYLTVPVVAAGRVTAILHADHDEIEIGESDLTALHSAAEICGIAEERTALRSRIAARHDRAGDAFRALRQALHEIEHSRLSLADALPAADTEGQDHPASLDCCGVLSSREHEIFAAIARGTGNADVAQRLFIAEGTVKAHVRRIYRKLNLTSRAEAAALLRRRHADSEPDERR
ncbi:LuxR C-terminal-related transcriptional regulator [Gordonia paraffinivorans]|uniref:LuxR C-terminal-related transcriptional regulator n=1 Tax=Gordonia paraffinivorans TaxID=175628 RepID=UPI0003472F25|nr:LuxR C-terminal-related transcriptional regulator [Gordonia paraffinivorans]